MSTRLKSADEVIPQKTLGLTLAVGSYTIWSLYPFYWVLILSAPVFEVLAHRMIWSLVFICVLLPFMGGFTPIMLLRHDRRKLQKLLFGALLIGLNWATYIYSISIDEVMQASLGYYMSPLICAFMAMIFLGERLRQLQYLAVGLIVVGIGIALFVFGEIHWISIVLAVTFSIYSVVRRQIKMPALQALFIEVLPAALIGLGYLYYLKGGELFFAQGETFLLMVAMGPVTIIPLLLYGLAVNRAPLVPVALLFYIVPTCLLIISVGFFDEPLQYSDIVVFVFVWLGLLVYGIQAWKEHRLGDSI